MTQGVLTAKQWNSMSEDDQRAHLRDRAVRLDIDLDYTADVADLLEELYEASAQSRATHAWIEMILMASVWCPRRKMIGRLDPGDSATTWVDCGTRGCERCSYWLAYRLADQYASSWAKLVDDPSQVHLIEVESKRAVATVLRHLNAHGAPALRIPLGDEGAVILTTFDLGTGQTLADEGTTFADALLGLLLDVEVGARVKPNKQFAIAVAVVKQEAETPPRDDVISELVVITRTMRGQMMKRDCVTSTCNSGWGVTLTEDDVDALVSTRRGEIPDAHPLPRKKAA